jgi:hypothetical protein
MKIFEQYKIKQDKFGLDLKEKSERNLRIF